MRRLRRTLPLLLLALVGCATSTPRASVGAAVPLPSPLRSVDGDVTAQRVGGMLVLVRRMPGAELVAVSLAIRGGVQNVNARTAGVELLGLRTAVAGGTEQLDKDAFLRRLSKLGSTLDVVAAANYSLLQAKSLRADFEPTFALLQEVFLHPRLSESELALQRERLVHELRREQESADDALQALTQTLLFAGTPYANRAQGTEDSVLGLTSEDVRTHLVQLRAQNRLLLVVVGDVEPGAVFALAAQAFGGLPEGAPLPAPPPLLHFSEPRLLVQARPLPTNYILASYAGPLWSAPDFAAARLATEVLSSSEFLEVRSKRNLSYAPEVRLSTTRPQSFGGLYLSTVDPKAALPLMQRVVRELAEQPLSEAELQGYRAGFLVDFFLGEETTDGAAQKLVEAELLGGDWRLLHSLQARIQATGPKDVQAFVQKYVRDYQVAVVGDPKKVDLSLLH